MADFTIKIDPDQIATIIWDCPQKPFNILNFEAIKLLDTLIDKILIDENIIGAVITSAKPDFAAGMDLKVLADLKKFQEDDYVAWIGHATFLIKLGATTIITDPVFSKNAGPLIFGPKRFTEPALKLNEIPKTDIFLLTHNHYDHQDMMTIRRFPFKDAKVLLP